MFLSKGLTMPGFRSMVSRAYPIAVTGSMPAPYRMHDQVALCYFCHNLDGLCQGPIVHSEMLHGIQMEAHSNTTVIHDGNQVSD